MLFALSHHFSQLNWLAVLVATVITSGLGALWYGPLFGKAWMRLVEKDPESLGSSTLPMVGSIVLNLITAVILGVAVEALDIQHWPNGLALGLGLGFGLYACNLFSDFLWDGRPMKLCGIQSGYRVLSATIIATILTAW